MNRSPISATLREPRWSAASVVLGLRLSLLLILAGLVASFTPRGSAQDQRVPDASPAITFAFSDFDGDLRPDLAFVQPGRSNPFSTDYWIQLRLTSAGSQSIRVIAPSGGLQVATRDVNGDLFPDLVLTSWRNQPVAILLNDGHGKFSRVDPTVFPAAFSPSETNWAGPPLQSETLLVVFSQSRSDSSPAFASLTYLRSSGNTLPRGELPSFRDNDRPARPGRAPPSVVL